MNLTAAVGSVLAAPELVRAARARELPAESRRLAETAAVFGFAITEQPRGEWYTRLAALSSTTIADDTRAFASRAPISERAAFIGGLNLALIRGAAAAQAGVPSDSARGYAALSGGMQRALESIRRPTGALAGFGAVDISKIQDGGGACTRIGVMLGTREDKVAGVRADFRREFGKAPTDAEVEYYGAMRWCTAGAFRDEPQSDMRVQMRAIKSANVGTMPVRDRFPGGPTRFDYVFQGRNVLGDAGDFISNWIRDNLGPAFDMVIRQIGEMGRQASSILCTGIRKLFTGNLAPVGDVICRIIELTIGGLADSIRSGVMLLKLLFTGLGEFLAQLMRGDFSKAAMALVKMVNGLVMVLLAGPISGLLGLPMVKSEVTAAQRARGVVSLEELSERLPPEFTILLVSSTVGVITAPGPTTISALAVAVSPAIAIILAPVLKNGPIAEIRALTITQIERAIQTLVKIGAMVVAGVMKLQDVLAKFWNAIQSYARRLSSDPQGTLQRLGDSFVSKFTPLWEELVRRVTSGQIPESITACQKLVTTLPDLFVAIAMEDADLRDIAETTKRILDEGKTLYAQAASLWDEALKKEPSAAERVKLMQNQFDAVKRQLCVANPSDPRCTEPKPETRIVEKVVEKVVYVDRPSPPAAAPPKAAAPKAASGGAAALALAAGGFLVGGPIGAAAGAAIGLVAGGRA